MPVVPHLARRAEVRARLAPILLLGPGAHRRARPRPRAGRTALLHRARGAVSRDARRVDHRRPVACALPAAAAQGALGTGRARRLSVGPRRHGSTTSGWRTVFRAIPPQERRLTRRRRRSPPSARAHHTVEDGWTGAPPGRLR